MTTADPALDHLRDAAPTCRWDAASATPLMPHLSPDPTHRLTREHLDQLGDCHSLPHSAGPEAERLFAQARDLLGRAPAGWGEEAERFRKRAARLRDICARMAELRNRPLFYALGRRVWDPR